MRKLYSLMFIIALMLTFGFISDIEAINLPDSTGKITVTRQVTGVHNPVTNIFTYTLTATSGNPATISGVPKTITITFNNVSPTIASGAWYGTATQTGTLDLTGLNFTVPGDYTFKLEESSQNYYYLSDYNSYTITIAVRNSLDENNLPTGNLSISLANIKKNNGKVQNIDFSSGSNEDKNEIYITKEVHGNMSDTNEYFKILVNAPCTTGNEYLISYYNYDNYDYIRSLDNEINYNGSTINRAPISIDDFGDDEYYGKYTCGSTNYVYLKHGETAKINSYAMINSYSFTEQGASNYKTYINGSATNNKQSGSITYGGHTSLLGNCSISPCIASNITTKERKAKNLSSIKLLEEGNNCPVIDTAQYCSYDRNAIVNVATLEVPTGNFIKYVPYAVLVIVIGAALVMFFIVNKKHKKNEIKEM